MDPSRREADDALRLHGDLKYHRTSSSFMRAGSTRATGLLRIATCGLVLLGAGVALRAASAPVSYDWFEYQGRDATEPQTGPDEYANPLLAGFFPDPSVCRVGDDFYLINSTFAYFPGIPIFHSRDLVNWRQVGHVIQRAEQLRFDRVRVSEGVYAPAIEYHDGRYYVVSTQVGGDGNFIVTATHPAGPWSDATGLGFEGIDPSLFFDDDGRAWIVNNGPPQGPPLYTGHRAIWIQEFDYRAMRMVGPRKVIVNGGVDISTKPSWIEGPHIFKRDGLYYLSCAEGGTGPKHSQVIFRSRNVAGPYTPWEGNPILTQRDLSANATGAVTCTGHADLFIGPDGKWWAVFLGERPYRGRYSPMGRETFMLPVKWTDDGWPVILPPGERVPLSSQTPLAGTVKLDGVPTMNGRLVWRDDFVEEALSPAWMMLRAPQETWWSLDRGCLELTPRADTLSGRGNPSFLGRRVQHARFTASAMVATPAQAGVDAGLAVFRSENHHFFAYVNRDASGVRLTLERAHGAGAPEQMKSVRLPEAAKVALRFTADEASCGFEYSTNAGTWEILAAGQDATLLTTAVAGGFVGATVGPHARIVPIQNEK